ncbi:MAG: hypothetical protein JWM27_4865 [Gemmatimonadetes bacterium]|nr:hypothetical protein [Gemmatimonadota bacterium]
MSLSSNQLDLLRALATRGPLPREEADGRSLRALVSRGLAQVTGSSVRATPAGEAALGGGGGEARNRAAADPGRARLSEAQEDVLRSMVRQTAPLLADHVDGRVLRALVGRGLARVDGDWASATDSAAAHLRAWDRAERKLRHRRAATSPEAVRAEVVLRAVEQLEAATPPESVVLLAGHPAYADDLLAGLRRYARALGRRGQE